MQFKQLSLDINLENCKTHTAQKIFEYIMIIRNVLY